MNYKEKTIFVLGTNPSISMSELIARLGDSHWQVSNPLALFDQNIDNPSKLIKELGGTIKIARVLSVLDNNNQKNIQTEIQKYLKPQDGKFKFGISNYSDLVINTKTIGMEIKNWLKEQGVSTRYVSSKEAQLSSVVVEQNGLLKNGIEIIIAKFNDRIILAQTTAVQAFKDLSLRDYGRPDRDDLSGMLPPKLAQIMINLSESQANKIIMDPFSGSGTIMAEALLMGYTKIFGSDISKKAVHDSKQNIKWLRDKFQIKTDIKSLINLDATKLAKSFSPNSINAIVTEPFLGPQRGKIDAEKITSELNTLYSQTIKQFAQILKPGAKAVMIWPALTARSSTPKFFLNPELHGLKNIPPLPDKLAIKFKEYLSPRGNLLYGRKGQKVWREILILEK